jgi:hypothetical protein
MDGYLWLQRYYNNSWVRLWVQYNGNLDGYLWIRRREASWAPDAHDKYIATYQRLFRLSHMYNDMQVFYMIWRRDIEVKGNKYIGQYCFMDQPSCE